MILRKRFEDEINVQFYLEIGLFLTTSNKKNYFSWNLLQIRDYFILFEWEHLNSLDGGTLTQS